MTEKRAFLVELLGKRHDLEDLAENQNGQISIGRFGYGSNIEIGQDSFPMVTQSISRHHATIYKHEEGRFYIKDNKSTFGTSINGHGHVHRLNGEQVRLEHGDKITFGHYSAIYEESE